MLGLRGRAALLLPIAFLVPAVAACSAAAAGSAQPASSGGSSAASAVVTTASPTTGLPPFSAPASMPPAPSSSSSAPSSPSPEGGSAAVSGGWTSAVIEFGGVGIPSPTGDLDAVPRGSQICFQAVASGGPAPCGDLAPGEKPVFVVFSPDGSRLLVVGGPDEQARAVYVLDTADGRVRTIGPAGIADGTPSPERWHLSSVAWSSDGSAVVLVPHTDGDTGPVLSADLSTGTVGEQFRLPADLANGRPSIWPTRDGTAVVANAGDDVQSVWWADAATGEVRRIGRFDEAGGSMVLAAADPLGRSVFVCPRKSDGRLGATIGIGVRTGESNRILTDSVSCAGAVFSPDGRYAAMTAGLQSGYALTVIDLAAARRVLTVPVPAAEPSVPPYLTWLGDTVVISDLSGEWTNRALVVRLR